MESCSRHNPYYRLVLIEFSSTVLTFCLHKDFHNFREQNLCSINSSLQLSFCSSELSKFRLDGLERQSIWLQTTVCAPLEQLPVEKF